MTSQDINNTAIPLSVKNAVEQVYLPQLDTVIDELEGMVVEYKDIALLARTHGQPASPSRLGKEIAVFVQRLKNQIDYLKIMIFYFWIAMNRAQTQAKKTKLTSLCGFSSR